MMAPYQRFRPNVPNNPQESRELSGCLWFLIVAAILIWLFYLAVVGWAKSK